MQFFITVLLALLIFFTSPVTEHFKVPSWTIPPARWAEAGRGQHELNKKDIAGGTFDIAVYGDSITAGLRIAQRALGPVIASAFGPSVKFGAFGAPANTVEGLAWRLMSGAEKPRVDPKYVVLWIGTNNLGGVAGAKDPSPRMDELVRWARGAFKQSKIVVLALTPRVVIDVRATNAKYREIARKHGAIFASCGTNMDPSNKALFTDGLHLTPAGYTEVLRCLGTMLR